MGREAELAGGLLLQGRCCEGRGGRAAARLGLHRRDLEDAGLDRLARSQGRGIVSEVELLELLAVVLDQPGQEGIGPGGDLGLDGPVLLGPERLDLDLAVDHQPQGDGLHPARRTGARQLAPEHRREGEADQVVQGAAGQVGVDQLHVDGARMLHRLGDGGLGDGVEHHPLDLGALDRLLAVQHLQHVPGDRLALAVRVGGEDDLLGALGGFCDVAEPLLSPGVDLPDHREVVVRIHRSVLGG